MQALQVGIQLDSVAMQKSHAEERRMHCLHTCYAAAPPAAAGMFVENRRSLNLTATSAKKSQSNIELSWVSTYSWS